MFLLEMLSRYFLSSIFGERNEPTVRKIANAMINAKSPRPHSQRDIKEWWGLWQTKALVPYLKRGDAALHEWIQSS